MPAGEAVVLVTYTGLSPAEAAQVCFTLGQLHEQRLSDAGEAVGSVSGGCVEGAVVGEALEVLRDGTARLARFGYSDDEAFAVGLTCGGTIHLLIEPLDW